MIYLSGCATRERFPAMRAAGIGLMLTPRAGNRPAAAREVAHWAADNGCYSAGDQFDLGHWLAWLDRMAGNRDTCLFAVVPDVVADARATIKRWERTAHLVRPSGYPLAYVLQDGQEHLPVPWAELDWLFIGGSTAWKLGPAAAGLVAEAGGRGIPVHMGRVNSGRRLCYAARLGCASCDGTYMAFNPSEAIDRMGRWLRIANVQRQQLALPLFEEVS